MLYQRSFEIEQRLDTVLRLIRTLRYKTRKPISAISALSAFVLKRSRTYRKKASSNLIVSKGYEQEADDYYKRAIERGQIVVGVEVHGEGGASQFAEAQRILHEAGAKQLLSTPAKPTSEQMRN